MRGLRPLTVLVAALLLAITLVLTGIVRRVVDDQEERLAVQRTRELNTFLGNLVNQVESGMASIAALAALTGTDPAAFDTLVDNAGGQLGEVVLLAEVGEDAAEVLAGTGTDPGTDLDGERLSALQRAGAGLAATTAIPGEGSERVVGFAVPVRAPSDAAADEGGAEPLTPPYRAVYTEFAFNPDEPSISTSGEPFADLDMALYADDAASEDQLVLLAGSGERPAGDDVERAALQIGVDAWTLEVQPRTSLVGSAAKASSWIVLAAGLAITVIGAALTEVLRRRQDYAVALVDERTAELEEAQAQLVRSERLAAIGGLASAVGHELRNPLGVISNAHYLLRTKLGAGASPDVRRHLATAERETAAATLIVSDLLEFARSRQPIPTRVDLGDLLGEALEVAPPPAGVEVRNEVEDDLIVQADRDQLRQVLLNLITNGYDAVGDEGRLEVEARRVDGAVHVTVADTGAGVPAEAKEQIFEPFFTNKAKGIGLGLTVTRRIVEAHGGQIRVDDRPGGGTRFEVALPAGVDGQGQ